MLIWTKPAKEDVMEFINTARLDSQTTIKNYFLKLIEYIEILDQMPYLGKQLHLFSNDLHIRQIIFRSHKVIYVIINSNVYILTVIHSKMDNKTVISKIIDSLENSL